GRSEAVFPVVDAVNGERWTVQPNSGTLPWWILSANRRVPHTRARDYFAALTRRRADPGGASYLAACTSGRGDPWATIAPLLDPRHTLFRRLWEPLAVAGLNTSAEQGSAALFWRMLAETLGRGGGACRPVLPRVGLSESFVEPALARLRAKGAEIRFGARLRALIFGPDRV